jgi:hypothetical protein
MSYNIEFQEVIQYRNEKGHLHRLDGPAYIGLDGVKCWWVNGLRHREDGPAVEYTNGTKYYYLNHKHYTEQEWQEEVIKIKLQRLKSYGN